jgi:hypothetical protein
LRLKRIILIFFEAFFPVVPEGNGSIEDAVVPEGNGSIEDAVVPEGNGFDSVSSPFPLLT